MLKRFSDFDNAGRLLVFVVMVFHSHMMEMNGFGVVARWN
jgi:hypothetical protein